MQVSNYFILRDSPFELEEGQIKRFPAEMPPAAQFVKATARPVLSFNLEPRSDHLKFIVLLNDFLGDPNNIPNEKVVFDYDASGSKHRLVRMLQEVLDGNDFIANAENLIDFRVIIGKARLSDIILSFRVET